MADRPDPLTEAFETARAAIAGKLLADGRATLAEQRLNEALLARPRLPTPIVGIAHGGFPIKVGENVSRLAQDAKPSASAGVSAVRPNAGITAAYRRKLKALVAEMTRSYLHWIRAAYRANPPAMALDALPAAELQRELDRLARKWGDRFDEAAPELARYFARRAWRRSDDALKSILRNAGMSVQFKMTRAMRDVLASTIEENVGLIRSIPEQFHTKVQGAVMRSVQTGRDLDSLTRELMKNHGVTARRAAFIALDQNNKATSSMQKARQVDLNLEEGVWLHSHAGKEPRPTHLANHGKKFSIKDGWFDPDPRVRRRIMPGELIRCRCVWKVVVPGLT